MKRAIIEPITLYAILGTQGEGTLVPALGRATGLFLSFGVPLLQGSYCVEGYQFDDVEDNEPACTQMTIFEYSIAPHTRLLDPDDSELHKMIEGTRTIPRFLFCEL